MRTLRIDFTSENILPDGCIAGRIGEHNATTLLITPPSEITACESASNLCIAFFTGVGIIHSEVMPKADKLQISLWKQLTQYSTLAVQLEAYDDNGDLVVKSSVISLKLLPSLCGEVVEVDTENPDLTAQVAQNSKSRHNHDNGAVLDCFGLNYAGNRPTFMGKNNIVAFQSDILDRLRDYALTSAVPNAATVDGSKLKMQRKTNDVSVDLFSVDLPVSSERPTAVFEFEGSTSSFAIADGVSGNDILFADFYMEANIPIGAEIKSIEFMYDDKNLVEKNTGWIDIREMESIDTNPYILNMYRTFLGDNVNNPGITCFALVTFINNSNFLHAASHADINGKFRITYYTDNIGGENNA